MLSFLHNNLPNPIAFQWGILTLHWYGVMLALGLLAAIFVIRRLLPKYNYDPAMLDSLLFYVVIPAIIGARIYYVIYAWEFYQAYWWGIFAIWEGGLAIHGVLLGGLLGLWLYTRHHQVKFWQLLDILIPGVALGQAIGRWGNYFNQELYGLPTDMPWGIPIQQPMAGFETATHFHPTFLYESLLNISLAGGLLAIHAARLWLQRNFYQKKNNFAATNLTEFIMMRDGFIFSLYIFSYSIIRASMEVFRIDYSPVVFGLRWAQLISFVLVAAVFIYWCSLAYQYFQQNKKAV